MQFQRKQQTIISIVGFFHLYGFPDEINHLLQINLFLFISNQTGNVAMFVLVVFHHARNLSSIRMLL